MPVSKKYKIGAVIPLFDRRGVNSVVIQKLLKQIDCDVKIICIGDDEARDEAVSSGAEFYKYRNNPLGSKWQFGIDILRNKYPDIDAYLHIGSDDFITNDYCSKAIDILKTDETIGMVGNLGFFIADASTEGMNRLIFWKGYTVTRVGEPVGAGRVISRAAMDSLEWLIMDPALDSSLDSIIISKLKNAGLRIEIMNDESACVLSVKVNTMPVKNKFESFVQGSTEFPKQFMTLFIDHYFPEAMEIFKNIPKPEPVAEQPVSETAAEPIA